VVEKLVNEEEKEKELKGAENRAEEDVVDRAGANHAVVNKRSKNFLINLINLINTFIFIQNDIIIVSLFHHLIL
tara:strand:+ start:186 stop:407 length:222 start_codon:yes stop_codon:yes gene_type:complete